MLKSMIRKNLLILLLFYCQLTIAQTVLTFSPGIKLGYAFGEKGEFVYGFECSLVIDDNNKPNDYRYGLVISWEIFKEEKRIHFGGEVNFSGDLLLFGLEIGPTIIVGENQEVGISFTPYCGAFIIPYLRLNIFPRTYTDLEVGTFLKLHIPVQGKYTFN